MLNAICMIGCALVVYICFYADNNILQHNKNNQVEHEAHQFLSQKNTDNQYHEFIKKYWFNKTKQQRQLILHTLHKQVHRHADSAIHWFNIGRFYSALGNFEEAKRAFFNAQKTSQNNEFVLFYLQYQIDANQGVFDRTALQRLSVFITENPTHEGAYMMLIMHHMRQQNFKQAMSAVKRLEKVLSNKQNRESALQKLQLIKQAVFKQIQSSSNK